MYLPIMWAHPDELKHSKEKKDLERQNLLIEEKTAEQKPKQHQFTEILLRIFPLKRVFNFGS